MASIPILFVFAKAEAMGFVYNARVFQDDVGPLSGENFAFTIVCRQNVAPIDARVLQYSLMAISLPSDLSAAAAAAASSRRAR